MRRRKVARAGGPVGRRLSGDGGAAVVEAAFVLPVLFTVIFAIYAICTAFNAKTLLTGAAREGARAVALKPGDGNPAGTAFAAARSASPGLDNGTLATGVPTACPSNPGSGDNATVTVSYQLAINVPFVRITSLNLSAKASMRCGL